MLDEHGEELYFDLREYHQFDLIAWLAGEVRGTPSLVLAMLRQLPEGARYTAIMSAPESREGLPEPAYDPEAEALYDRRFWTADRQHTAQMLNALYNLVTLTGHWKKGKEPDFPVVGPIAWHPPEQRKKELEARKPEGPVSVLDAMKAWGFQGQLTQ